MIRRIQSRLRGSIINRECADQASYCKVDLLRQVTEERRDYSGVISNAIESSGNMTALDKNNVLLHFVFTVSPLSRGGDAGDPIINRLIDCSPTDDFGNYDCADVGPA